MIPAQVPAQEKAVEPANGTVRRGSPSGTKRRVQKAPRGSIANRKEGSTARQSKVIHLDRSNRRPDRAQSEKRYLIRRRVTGETLYCDAADSMAALMQAAARNGVCLAGAELPNARLTGASLDGIWLSLADLTYADFSNASMRGCDLKSSDLVGARLNGANLQAADMMRVNLTGADLSGARLHKANLGNAELAGANLRDADLSYCNLNGCNLTGASLEGAKIEGTTLHGAVRDRVAQDKAERRKELDRLVFRPTLFVLTQFFMMAVQVFGFFFAGPAQMFWFAGVTLVNAYLMMHRSWWWGLGLIWQTIFLAILWYVCLPLLH